MVENKMVVFLTEAPNQIMIKKYVSLQEGAKLFSMGVSKFRVVAGEAGSVYVVGKKVLVNVEEFEAYLQTFKV